MTTRTIRTILAAWLAAALAFQLISCGGGGGGGVPASQTGVVQGWVYVPVGNVSGSGRMASTAPEGFQPLPGAAVSLSPAYTATTGLDGRYAIENVPVGSYNMTISAQDYDSLSIPSVQVRAGLVTTPTPEGAAAGAMTPASAGSLAVDSLPRGAGITVNGHPTGLVTPKTLEGIKVGTHSVEVGMPGYSSPRAMVSITEDETSFVDLTLAPIPGDSGTIAVTSIPAGARILLDGEYTGLATPASLTAPVGLRTVSARLDGYYAPTAAEVMVADSQTAAADLVLTRIADDQGLGDLLDAFCSAFNAESAPVIFGLTAPDYSNSRGETREQYRARLQDFFAGHSPVEPAACAPAAVRLNGAEAVLDWRRGGVFRLDADPGRTVDLDAEFSWTLALIDGDWLITRSTNNNHGSVSGRLLTGGAGRSAASHPDYPADRGRLVHLPEPGGVPGFVRPAPVRCESGSFIAGELVVRFPALERVLDTAAMFDLDIADLAPDGLGLVRFDLGGVGGRAADLATAELCRLLNRVADFEWAELNYRRRPSAITPNDPFFSSQWALEQINLPQAWTISRGSSSVAVAVLDSGIAANADIDGRIIPGYDFIDRDADPTDTAASGGYHGTHVAGIIGAATDNGLMVAGVTWEGPLLIVRILGADGGGWYEEVQGMRYAARLTNSSGLLPPVRADVINLSLGGDEPCRNEEQSVVDEILDLGIVIAAASGNRSQHIDAPANCRGVIAVGAVDRDGVIAAYSNFGPGLSVTAPGGKSSITGNHAILSLTRDGTKSMFGTSMATPHVSGLAALIKAVDPNLGALQIKQIIEMTATDLGDPGYDVYYGHGLINAYEALKAAQGAPVAAAAPAQLNFGADLAELGLLVFNSGSGTLTTQAPVKSGPDGAAWLDLSSAEEDQGLRITARVDRTGLPDGAYQATVSVPTSAGSLEIGVSMAVAAATGADLGSITVQARDQAGTVYARTATTAASGYDYQLQGLDQGTYLIYAGTETHGLICRGSGQAGEYCGVYPMGVIVNSGAAVADVDFGLEPD